MGPGHAVLVGQAAVSMIWFSLDFARFQKSWRTADRYVREPEIFVAALIAAGLTRPRPFPHSTAERSAVWKQC
jgi:hypothetical protein